MTAIKYPKGIKPFASNKTVKKQAAVKRASIPGHGNRGMAFEDAINKTNEYYILKNLAVITKRPTPINIVSVDYTKGALITKAYFETQSTTDYNGVYNGHYIDFEAKSTRSKTSFPLSNIQPQQITHLEHVLLHKGWAFFLIHFALLDEVYLLPAEYVIDFYHKRERASIPYEDFKTHGKKIRVSYNPPCDYLPEAIALFEKE